MLFAVAFVYEDLPRHDRVEQVGDLLKYFDKGNPVYEEIKADWIIVRHPRMGLDFVEAETATAAHKKFRDDFPKHITAITVARVPNP